MKIVIGGQIDKEMVKTLVQKHAKENTTIEIKTDLEAAMAIKSNQADYYFGACNTGGGGALAMAIALIGMDKCVTVSMPGKVLTDELIIENVNNGKVAFGFTPQHADKVIPVILAELNKKEEV